MYKIQTWNWSYQGPLFYSRDLFMEATVLGAASSPAINGHISACTGIAGVSDSHMKLLWVIWSKSWNFMTAQICDHVQFNKIARGIPISAIHRQLKLPRFDDGAASHKNCRVRFACTSWASSRGAAPCHSLQRCSNGMLWTLPFVSKGAVLIRDFPMPSLRMVLAQCRSVRASPISMQRRVCMHFNHPHVLFATSWSYVDGIH